MAHTGPARAAEKLARIGEFVASSTMLPFDTEIAQLAIWRNQEQVT